MIATTQSPNAELGGTLPNGQTLEYATVIVGRDLSSYLIALILSQHGHQAVVVSGPSAPVMDDLHEYLALKYLHEAARRHRSIRSLTKQGFQIDFDRSASPVDWQQLRRQCHDEFLQTKENLERLVAERDITVYEGTIVMLEDYLVRIVSEDELTHYAAVRTKCVILGSGLCRRTIRDESKKTDRSSLLRTLADVIDLEHLPKSLAVIGGGTIGLSVASCMKELGCTQVTVLERRSHCLSDANDIDREIAAYIESCLVSEKIDIITNCTVKYVTSTASYFMGGSMKSDDRFAAIGAQRKPKSILNTPSAKIVQLIERALLGRQIQMGRTIDDENGRTIVQPITPIIPIDYQRVKSICSIEQAVSIAYRTICRCFNDPKPNFQMPSFLYMIPPLLLMGCTRTPADDMFICRVSFPLTMKYAIDTPPCGFGKLWISRTRKTLRGVQMVSEHAAMLGKAFGILIRHQIPLSDVCVRLELPGSIGEAVQLMVKQAMARIRNDIQPPSPPHQDETNDVSE